MRVFSVLVLILIFDLSANVHPLSAQAVRILSLKSCVEAALKNHPSITEFRKMEESKVVKVKSLEKQNYPMLDFISQGVDYGYTGYKYRTFENRVNFVWDLGKWIGKLKDLGIAEEKIAEYKSRLNRLNLVYQVEQAYFNLVSYIEETRIARLSEAYLKHHLNITQKLFSLGQINRLDLYFTQSELASARERVLAVSSESDRWRIQLSNLTGLKITSKDSLILIHQFPMGDNLSSDSLFAVILQKNPMLLIWSQQIRMAALQEKLVKSSRFPKIYFGGGYVFDNDPTSGGNYWVLSGGIQFPLFDWGMRKNKAETFHLKNESLKAARKAFLLELRTDIEQLVSQVNHLRSLLLLKEKTIQQAQKTYDYTEMNYQAGIATNTDVLLAQRALTAAKVSREKIILTIQITYSQINTLLGQAGVLE